MVISFAQCTIITHDRLLDHTQTNTNEDTNATDKEMDQPYRSNQTTTILNGEGTSGMKKSVAKKDNRLHINKQNERSTIKVADPQNKVKLQTVSLLDKLTATTTATIVDPESTTSTQAQQTDVNATSTTARPPKHPEIIKFLDTTQYILSFLNYSTMCLGSIIQLILLLGDMATLAFR